VVGRTKLDDVELADDVKPTNSHVALNTITNPTGAERQIFRSNMPFGRLGDAEFGTYFIGYSATPDVTEEMLRNMFIGKPPGNYDRILDFSTAVTGGLFFVPSADFLDNLPEPPGVSTADAPATIDVSTSTQRAVGEDSTQTGAVRVFRLRVMAPIALATRPMRRRRRISATGAPTLDDVPCASREAWPFSAKLPTRQLLEARKRYRANHPFVSPSASFVEELCQIHTLAGGYDDSSMIDCQKFNTRSGGWWISTACPNSGPPENQLATAPPTDVVSKAQPAAAMCAPSASRSSVVHDT